MKKKNVFLPKQKKKRSQRKNPNNFSRKIRHELLLSFGIYKLLRTVGVTKKKQTKIVKDNFLT